MAVIPSDKCEECGSIRVRRTKRKHVFCDDCKHVGGVKSPGARKEELKYSMEDVVDLRKLAKQFGMK